MASRAMGRREKTPKYRMYNKTDAMDAATIRGVNQCAGTSHPNRARSEAMKLRVAMPASRGVTILPD
jgi:hypothetical protein